MGDHIRLYLQLGFLRLLLGFVDLGCPFNEDLGHDNDRQLIDRHK